MDSLLTWAVAKGATVRKLSPSPNNPRELVVSERVDGGETLISVPQPLLLHAGTAFEDPEFGQCFRQIAQEAGLNGADLRPILCLLLVLEKARQDSSRWSPYISILPESYDDPFWWRDEQIRLLRGTRLGRAVATYHAGLQQLTAWAQRLEKLHGAPSVLSTYRNGWALTEAAARWARSVVWSRSFTVRHMADGSHNVVAMVPVLDMIDHSPEREVVWHTGMEGTDDFQFVSLQGVPKGLVMTNNYGTKPSDELLLAYGFLLGQPNPADYFQVSLAHSRHHHALQQQAKEAGHGEEARRRCQQVVEEIDGEDPVAQQLVAEDVQRTLALFSLGLKLEHQLTLQRPLPAALVRAAQLCLMHAPQLYMLSTHLLQGRLNALHAPAGSGDVVPVVPNGVAPAAHRQALQQLSGRKRTGDSAGLPDREDLSQEDEQPQGAGSTQSSAPATEPGSALGAVLTAPSAMHIKPLAALHGGAAAGKSAAQEASSVEHLPLPQELEALVSLHHQLDSKLAVMVTDEDEEVALHGARAPAGAAGAAPAEQAAANGTAAPLPGKPHHTQLAVQYLRSQKRIIRSSLAALEDRVSGVVRSAAEHASSAAGSGVLTYLPLQPALPSQAADAAGAEVQGAVPVQGPWTSIDPDVHLQQYQAWGRQYGFAASSSQQGQGSPAMCLLQEVVCQRNVNGASASSGMDAQPSSTGRAGRPGGRGPPSASRTFRSLKPAQPLNAQSAGGGSGTGAAGSSSLKRVAMPQGMSASIGIDSDHDPTTLGVRVTQDVQAGDVLLSVPDEACLIAASRPQLVSALMASAHQLLQSLLAAIAPFASGSLVRGSEPAAHTASIAAAKVALSTPVDMLTWHLMHTVASAPACRVLTSDENGVQLLVDMLEDSPCAGAYQEAYENMKNDFHNMRMAALAGLNGSKLPNGTSNGKDNIDSFWRQLSWPSSLSLFSWAEHVVERCAMRVSGAAAAAAYPDPASGSKAGSSRSAPRAQRSQSSLAAQQDAWVLAPVLAAIPKELRGAVVQVRLQRREAAGKPARDSLAYTRMATPAPLSVVVSAACSLSQNLPLTPLLILPSLDVEDIMTIYGPEGLVWRQLLLQTGGGSGAVHSSAKGWDADGSSSSLQAAQAAAVAGRAGKIEASGAAGSTVTGASALPRSPVLSAHLLYELYICPGEDDMLAELKLDLLAASGLGCVHFLSEGLTAEAPIGAALKICLAGLEILEHPLAKQCTRLHSAMRSSIDADAQEGTGVAVGAASSAVAGAAPGAGGAGPLAHASSSSQQVPVDLQQQLLSAQTELVAMLAGLPEEHPVCRAARKQLRQMVHDARKNTRRRLRQLEAVHAHTAAHPSSSCTLAMSPFGGSYSPLGGSAAMHEGVRLYLQALCAVLDDCAERIGLNRQTDSMGGVKKASR